MLCVWIARQAEKRVVSMTRRDLSNNMLEVEHTGGVERWLVIKKVLCPKMVRDTHTHTHSIYLLMLSPPIYNESVPVLLLRD